MSDGAAERTSLPGHGGAGSPSRGLFSTICFAIGGFALMAAMATDFVSVIGRHFGLHIVGALEIVQYCIVTAVSAALVVATLNGAHAAVHVLTERMTTPARRAMARLSDALTAICFFGVLFGDVWLARDVWSSDERSDLLGLPIAPARLVWCASLALAFAIAVVATFRGSAKEPAGEL